MKRNKKVKRMLAAGALIVFVTTICLFVLLAFFPVDEDCIQKELNTKPVTQVQLQETMQARAIEHENEK